MGVYIKDMEMPGSCIQCKLWYLIPLADTYEDICRVTGHRVNPYHRADDCPLVEIPLHGRLIDADAISKHKYATIPPYRKEYSDGKPKSEDEVIAFKFGWNDAIDAIVANAPTIIPAEEGET